MKYFEPILSKHRCGFRKGCSAQNCFLEMVEVWKKYALIKKRTCRALLTELSKAFNWLPQKLLLAKLNATALMNHLWNI